MSDAVASVIVAIIGSIATIGVAWLGLKSGRGPFRKVEDAAVWKERHELSEAKREAEAERYERRIADLVDEKTDLEAALAEEGRRREFAEREADTADRRLNRAYAELRETGHLVDRRKEPRDPKRKEAVGE